MTASTIARPTKVLTRLPPPPVAADAALVVWAGRLSGVFSPGPEGLAANAEATGNTSVPANAATAANEKRAEFIFEGRWLDRGTTEPAGVFGRGAPGFNGRNAQFA